MVEIKIRDDGEWEVWHAGAICHTGTLRSCGKYIVFNAEEIEDFEN